MACCNVSHAVGNPSPLREFRLKFRTLTRFIGKYRAKVSIIRISGASGRAVIRLLAVITVVVALSGCAGDSGGFTPDIADETQTTDVTYLHDALIVGYDAAHKPTDTTVPLDLDQPADSYEQDDTLEPLDSQLNDNWEPELPSESDVVDPDGIDSPQDGHDYDEGSDDPGINGDIDLTPCDEGGDYCESDMVCDKGKNECIDIKNCSDEGELTYSELIAKLMLEKSIYVKVTARVWVGTPSCSQRNCPENEPCCNKCFSQLFIGDIGMPPLVLSGNTDDAALIGCQGTECEVKCEPFEPDKLYRFWGRVKLSEARGEFRIDGYCKIPEDEREVRWTIP